MDLTAVFVLKNTLYVDSVGIFSWQNNIRRDYLGLSYSSDSVNWLPTVKFSTSGTYAGYKYFNLRATCKYIKLTGYGNTDNDWTSILEYRAHPALQSIDLCNLVDIKYIPDDNKSSFENDLITMGAIV